MRGTLPTIDSSHRYIGIIPAYAGNTHGAATHEGKCWDHPRVCGEHSSGVTIRVVLAGSSPRMRGARPFMPPSNQRSGIIPAYVRNTHVQHQCSGCGRDHPRVCGEHGSSTMSNVSSTGSSPRMRGAHYQKRCISAVSDSKPDRKTSTQTLFTYQTTQLATLAGEQQQTETETLPTANTTHASLQKSLSVRHAENTHHRQRLQRNRLTLTRLMQSLSGVTSH